ncbi:acetone carboxylase subunit gamma [Conexibacter sp. SYSU D00693]|uniref:acetone carboxylase subunit gamma n=1 Tax=Conexibacter sp. SYSU D00693 TaxID=2812560 RepID=UPI00196B7BC5|nr:acetone carboxylase subunit gamma [Conexibacter sp. SYSU D00693]
MATIERITETLDVDLDTETWRCSRCGREHGSAHENYKRGLVVHRRDPAEVHRPLVDPEAYEYTFAPDAAWCQMLEWYCPGCAVMVEVEYLPPGHPITHDIELDLDWLRRRRAAAATTDQHEEAQA